MEIINNNKFLGLKEVRNITDNILAYFKENVTILKIDLNYEFVDVTVLVNGNKYISSFSYDIYKVDYLLSKKVEE